MKTTAEVRTPFLSFQLWENTFGWLTFRYVTFFNCVSLKELNRPLTWPLTSRAWVAAGHLAGMHWLKSTPWRRVSSSKLVGFISACQLHGCALRDCQDAARTSRVSSKNKEEKKKNLVATPQRFTLTLNAPSASNHLFIRCIYVHKRGVVQVFCGATFQPVFVS